MNALTVTIAVLCLLAAHAAEDCKDLCSAGALSCQTPEEASTCMTGYGLTSDNKCVKCGRAPAARGTGTGASGNNAGGGKWWEPWNSGSCVECKANCEVCGTKTTCTTCKNGYALVGGSCQACTVGQAATCDGDVTTATACKPGYSKQTDGKKCYTSCKAGQFEVAAAGTCTTCDANALTCTDATNAGSCDSGYLLQGGNCEACTVGQAATCTTDVATATTCKTGYQLKTGGKLCFLNCKPNQHPDAAAGTCTTCDANASSCTDATNADRCNSGYMLQGGNCEACTVTNCKTCNTVKTSCTACQGKYAPNAAATTCALICDAHATSCTDANTAASCDTAKGYHLSVGRCIYCDVPTNDAGGIVADKAGNKIFFDATNGRCGICDLNASGCASLSTASGCADKYTKSPLTGHCDESCPAWHKDIGSPGKCYSCGANVVGGYCASPGEGLRCNSGYHIKGAGQGYCCKDIASTNAAAGLVTSGALALASSFGALYMVM